MIASTLLSLLLLTLVYALALASMDPWDLLMGAALSGVLLYVYRGFLRLGPPPAGLSRRVLAFPPFAWAIFLDTVEGTWLVARVVLGPRPLAKPGIVAVPMEDRTESGVVATAISWTLSPGSFLVEVDWERRMMLFHVLDAGDPEAVRARFRRLYRGYQRHVFL